MSKYLPAHITEAHVFINDGVPMMVALWNGEPWIFKWKDRPPTWVSHTDLSRRMDAWEAMHLPVWQRQWLSQEDADLYHKLAFPQQVTP